MRNQQTENITGIYKITNKNNGKIYIGQSQNILLRWEQHKQGIKLYLDGMKTQEMKAKA